MINSLKAYEILKAGELSEAQAHAITEAIGSSFDDNNLQQAKLLAAKGDLDKLENKATGMETSLKQEMIRIESALHLDIARLETKMADMKSELLRWMFVFWVGQMAATVAMVKLLK